MLKEKLYKILEKEFNNYEITEHYKSNDSKYYYKLKMKGTTFDNIFIHYCHFFNNHGSNHFNLIVDGSIILTIYDYKMNEYIRLYKSEIDKYVLKQAESYKILENIKDIELNNILL